MAKKQKRRLRRQPWVSFAVAGESLRQECRFYIEHSRLFQLSRFEVATLRDIAHADYCLQEITKNERGLITDLRDFQRQRWVW